MPCDALSGILGNEFIWPSGSEVEILIPFLGLRRSPLVTAEGLRHWPNRLSPTANSQERTAADGPKVTCTSTSTCGAIFTFQSREMLDMMCRGATIPLNSQLPEGVRARRYELYPTDKHNPQLSPERDNGPHLPSSSSPGGVARRRFGIRGVPRMPRDLRIEGIPRHGD